MDEYIKKEAFLKDKRELYCADCNRRKNSKGKMVYDIGDAPCRACSIGDILDDVEDFPAADVRPVVRGKWEYISFMTVKCSNCQEIFHELAWDNFCPNCGAMIGNLSEEEHDKEQREYEAAIEAAQYSEMYEPSYDPETGAL